MPEGRFDQLFELMEKHLGRRVYTDDLSVESCARLEQQLTKVELSWLTEFRHLNQAHRSAAIGAYHKRMASHMTPVRKLTEAQLIRDLRNIAKNWPPGVTLVVTAEGVVRLQRDKDQELNADGAKNFTNGPVLESYNIPATWVG